MREINHEEIGRRIRKHRQRMGFSQEELASLVGESITKISRLESGKLDPQFDLISKISYYLQIKTDDLLEFGPLVRVAYTPLDRRPRIDLDPYVLHGLALHKQDNQMNPFYVIFTQFQRTENNDEIADRDDIVIFQHPGEEFLYVEDGVVKVYFAEKTRSGFEILFEHPELHPLTLYPGDSVCFDSNIPHTYLSVVEPEKDISGSVHLNEEEIDQLQGKLSASGRPSVASVISEMKKGQPARAIVVCSSMILKPEDLRIMKERFYTPRPK